MATLKEKWSGVESVWVVPQHEVAGNFTCQSHRLHIVAGGQGAVQATLPPALNGLNLFIKHMTNNPVADTLQLVPTGGALVDGVAGNFDVSSDKQSVHLVSDGTDWFIV